MTSVLLVSASLVAAGCVSYSITASDGANRVYGVRSAYFLFFGSRTVIACDTDAKRRTAACWEIVMDGGAPEAVALVAPPVTSATASPPAKPNPPSPPTDSMRHLPSTAEPTPEPGKLYQGNPFK